ncbi:hypothetical protein ACFL4L_02145 [bacterium]
MMTNEFWGNIKEVIALNKTLMLITVFIVALNGVVFSQPALADPSPSQNTFSLVGFERAFNQIIDASSANFKTIVLNDKIIIDDVECNEISVTLPSVLKTGYLYEEYADDYSYATENVIEHTIYAQYYLDDDPDEGLNRYDHLKEALMACQGRNIGGAWKLEEEDKPAIVGGYGRSLILVLTNENENKPVVTLSYYYSGIGPVSIYLNFSIRTVTGAELTY